MRIFLNLLVFQRNIILTALPISLLIAALTSEFSNFGFFYFLSSLLIHLSVYSIKPPKELYLYLNNGISRVHLFLSTIFISVLMILISRLFE